MITVKIDVTKIDKAKLFTGKNGAKYLDLVLFETPDDKYGNDYCVIQSVSKEERAAGKKGVILGNGKNIGGKTERKPTPTPAPKVQEQDDIPF